MEHLTQCLNVVCGRYLRAGQQIESGMLLQPDAPKRAQVIGPFGKPGGPESRFRGLRGYNGEMPCATLAQEITTPGPEQVRALIVNGGNPVAAWPDQTKTLAAMESLELLVVIDHRMTQTADFADYVFAPRLSLERADVPPFMDRWFRQPYACYSPAILEGRRRSPQRLGGLPRSRHPPRRRHHVARRADPPVATAGRVGRRRARPGLRQLPGAARRDPSAPGEVLPQHAITVEPADPDAAAGSRWPSPTTSMSCRPCSPRRRRRN